MSCKEQIYGVPMKKSCPNVYHSDTDTSYRPNFLGSGGMSVKVASQSNMRQGVQHWRPVPDDSHVPLKMAEDLNTCTSTVSNNSYLSKDSSISNGFPSHPNTKLSQRTFVKEINNAKKEPLGYVSSPVLEMKTHAIDYDNNGYLSPTNPPPYLYMDVNVDYKNTQLPSSPTGSDTSIFSYPKRGRQQRFDSGVADVESVRGSGVAGFSISPFHSSHSTPNPPISTLHEQHYEDIDMYSRSPTHQQHQAQHAQPRSSIDKYQEEIPRNGVRQLLRVNMSGATQSDSEDTDPVISTSLPETFSNPLHDPRIGSLPHTYMPFGTDKHLAESPTSTKVEGNKCWFIILPVIILFISLAALSLSIFVIVSKYDMSPIQQSQVSYDLNETFSSLQQKVEDLLKENTALKEHKNNLTAYVENKVIEITAQQQNMSHLMHLMEGRFDKDIANIRLTPGPQGPPGVLNFSLCVNRTLTRTASPSATDVTDTSYIPSDTEAPDYFVTFAYCSYSGATDAHLEAESASHGPRYRCKCWGLVKSKTQTLCTINIWMCPNRI